MRAASCASQSDWPPLTKQGKSASLGSCCQHDHIEWTAPSTDCDKACGVQDGYCIASWDNVCHMRNFAASTHCNKKEMNPVHCECRMGEPSLATCCMPRLAALWPRELYPVVCTSKRCAAALFTHPEVRHAVSGGILEGHFLGSTAGKDDLQAVQHAPSRGQGVLLIIPPQEGCAGPAPAAHTTQPWDMS